MEAATYTLAAQVEDEHWWFCGRRTIVRSVLNRYAPPSHPTRSILEVGCGNGGNLPLLSAYGRVAAVEIDETARSRASSRGIARVERGWLPDGIPFGCERFDLIAALDVLEHVDDDRKALIALRNRLAPQGLLVITVPAYRWLWSRHDELSHHKRRYTRGSVVSLLNDTGFEVLYSSYFNMLLFPFAVAQIKLSRIFSHSPYLAMKTPPIPVNKVLHGLFSIEGKFVPALSFPYGVSILACARAA